MQNETFITDEPFNSLSRRQPLARGSLSPACRSALHHAVPLWSLLWYVHGQNTEQYCRPSVSKVHRTGAGQPQALQKADQVEPLPYKEHGICSTPPSSPVRVDLVLVPNLGRNRTNKGVHTVSAVRRPTRDTQDQDFHLADRPGVSCSSFSQRLGSAIHRQRWLRSTRRTRTDDAPYSRSIPCWQCKSED
jgi:hypothetical protein